MLSQLTLASDSGDISLAHLLQGRTLSSTGLSGLVSDILGQGAELAIAGLSVLAKPIEIFMEFIC